MYDFIVDFFIIPYQEKLGNYNVRQHFNTGAQIIPYQEKLGNYNIGMMWKEP